MPKPSKFRGPNTFYFARKRHPMERLRAQKASALVCLQRRGGGSYDGSTGDGYAWHAVCDYLANGWCRRRPIKAGQWAGPWRRERIAST